MIDKQTDTAMKNQNVYTDTFTDYIVTFKESIREADTEYNGIIFKNCNYRFKANIAEALLNEGRATYAAAPQGEYGRYKVFELDLDNVASMTKENRVIVKTITKETLI